MLGCVAFGDRLRVLIQPRRPGRHRGTATCAGGLRRSVQDFGNARHQNREAPRRQPLFVRRLHESHHHRSGSSRNGCAICPALRRNQLPQTPSRWVFDVAVNECG